MIERFSRAGVRVFAVSALFFIFEQQVPAVQSA